MLGGCFPSLVLLLATLQNLSHSAGRSIKIIGDISYATYLLHFPVQLSAIWITRYYGITLDDTDTIWFVLFLGIVILVSVPTCYFFELPAQLFLRRHLKPLDSTGTSASPMQPRQLEGKHGGPKNTRKW